MNTSDKESEQPRSQPDLLVVTDLDGTLLDHHSYSFQAALPALESLRTRGVPVILCSSKTRAELVRLARALENREPLIVENGSAICVNPHQNGEGSVLPEDLVQGQRHEEIVEILRELRAVHQFEFSGFSDLTVVEVAELTGLPREEAALAAKREFSEPLIWRDSDQKKTLFARLLTKRGLTARQGGRFLTVSGHADKAAAVKKLRSIYGGRPLKVIALGDSFNDRGMLNSADIAVVVKSAHSADLVVERPERVIRTQLPGPAGWNKAILEILEDYKNG